MTVFPVKIKKNSEVIKNNQNKLINMGLQVFLEKINIVCVCVCKTLKIEKNGVILKTEK